jgi:hypothetical protein
MLGQTEGLPLWPPVPPSLSGSSLPPSFSRRRTPPLTPLTLFSLQDKSALVTAAKLLSCEPDQLEKAICTQNIKAGLDWISKPNSCEYAVNVKHALTKVRSARGCWAERCSRQSGLGARPSAHAPVMLGPQALYMPSAQRAPHFLP